MTLGVEKGEFYSFRYRASNLIGTSAWSPISKIQASGKPLAPPIPKYVSSLDTSITLSFAESLDNGGAQISQYKLFRDDGNLSSDIVIEVTDYDGQSPEHTISGLVAGRKYRFAYQAENERGLSPLSPIVTIAASSLPDPP